MTAPSWPSFLAVDANADGAFRVIIIVLAAALIIKYSTLFEEKYSDKLTQLYIYPWWRFLVVFLVLSSILWCPSVGVIVALISFFYLSDMNTLITPLTNL